MSSGVRSVLKTVAMIAVPFVAAVAAPFLAPIALTAAIGAAAATGLTGAALGAGLGALTGAVTGRGAGTGALIGGLGGGFGAYLGAATGGLGGMLPGYGAAAAPMALPGAAAITPVGGLLTGATPTGVGVGATTGIAGAVAPSAGTVASSLLTNLVGGITVPGLANLAMTLYNKPENELSPTERAALMETAQLAQTNQDLFKKRVEDAVTLRNMATPNPEQAFAEAQSATQRGLRESQRRYGDSSHDARRGALERQAAIEGVRAGTSAVRGEMARGFEQTRQAMAAMPTEAPGVTPATVAMQFEDMQRKRQAADDEQAARAVGGLFGTTSRSAAGLGQQAAGLFSPLYSGSQEPTLRGLFT